MVYVLYDLTGEEIRIEEQEICGAHRYATICYVKSNQPLRPLRLLILLCVKLLSSFT